MDEISAASNLAMRPGGALHGLRRLLLMAIVAWSCAPATTRGTDPAAEEGRLGARSVDVEAPLLVADLRSRLRESSGNEARYTSRFAEPAQVHVFTLPDIGRGDISYESDARLNVDLPAEDFKELDEYGPKLTTASLDANEQRSVVGGRLLWTTPFTEQARLQSEARLLWLCEFLQSPGANATAFFSPGESAIFATQGLSYGSNWAMLGGRWRWQLVGGLSAFAGYDAQVNSQQMFHIGSTGLGYAW